MAIRSIEREREKGKKDNQKDVETNKDSTKAGLSFFPLQR